MRLPELLTSFRRSGDEERSDNRWHDDIGDKFTNDDCTPHQYWTKTMPRRIDIPHRIIQHITVAIELLWVGCCALLTPRSSGDGIVR
jgi:hypothetical protein